MLKVHTVENFLQQNFCHFSIHKILVSVLKTHIEIFFTLLKSFIKLLHIYSYFTNYQFVFYLVSTRVIFLELSGQSFTLSTKQDLLFYVVLANDSIDQDQSIHSIDRSIRLFYFYYILVMLNYILVLEVNRESA